MILVVGPQYAGKSHLGQFVTKLGFNHVEGSNIVLAELRENGKKEETILEFCERMYAKAGKDYFSRRIHASLVKSHYDMNHTVITGPRTPAEILYYQRVSPGSKCIGVYADSQTRFQRYCMKASLKSKEYLRDEYTKFVIRDLVELTFGIAEIFSKLANYLLINEGTLIEYDSSIEESLKSIQNSNLSG